MIRLFFAMLLVITSHSPGVPADGVFVRFKMVEPAGEKHFVQIGGHIHKTPRGLPCAVRESLNRD